MASTRAKAGVDSGLEVRHPPAVSEAYDHSNLEAYQKGPAVHPNFGQDGYEPPKSQDISKRRIGQLSNRAFWALVAVALIVIIAAALGGGLGAGLSRPKGANTTSAAKSTTITTESSLPPPTTTTSSVQILLTEITNPTSTGKPSTLIRDCPSSDNTIYSPQFGSTTFQFRKICSQTIKGGGSDNTINTPTISLNECINMCAAWNAKGGYPPCQAVCWRNGFFGNDHPGVCFGYETTNTSTGFALEGDRQICDSAVWINQP